MEFGTRTETRISQSEVFQLFFVFAVDFGTLALIDYFAVELETEAVQIADYFVGGTARTARGVEVLYSQQKSAAPFPDGKICDERAQHVAQVHASAGRGRESADGRFILRVICFHRGTVFYRGTCPYSFPLLSPPVRAFRMRLSRRPFRRPLCRYL